MNNPRNLMHTNVDENKTLDVTIQIDSEKCAELILYFMHQQIPFSLSYLNQQSNGGVNSNTIILSEAGIYAVSNKP